MTNLDHIPVLVPADVDDSADLPIALLDSACNHLKCDVVDAARGGVPGKRYAAWAELAFQWARHTGVEKPDRETYRRYTATEVSHALALDRVPEPDPTKPADSSDESSGSESPKPSGDSQETSTGSASSTSS